MTSTLLLVLLSLMSIAMMLVAAGASRVAAQRQPVRAVSSNRRPAHRLPR